ncbi:YbjN domain-containing protein [Corynebacterium terpenotabidum]|uniref:Uncharacterized protein n=1 Tax=Corynebacterium terpenotabidum Y-11 TaxID=1200352 RepID=S4XC21_9CORY|nr:YbjN domain-containing protein [Corynebacterium terpenotabidum]AGP30141.1 hypothetical protein A606_02440 [Corynebacterium terpenotabidum Y-11]
MFGRKASTTRRLWKDAPDPGDVEVIPDPHPDAELAASVLRRVLVEVGGEDVAGFDVAVAVSVSPLTFTLEALWRGVADATADVILNRWNAGHTVPRVHAELDEEGRIRVCADSTLVSNSGVTVQQLDEWMRRALAGVSALGAYLSTRWTEGAEPVGSPDLPVASGDITALVTDDNRYGLRGGRTPAVLLPRLRGGEQATEVKDAGASGRRGNGYLRFPSGPDVVLHDGTLTVTDSVPLGETDADTVDWLCALCGRANAAPGGVVSVVDSGPGGTMLTCAVHRPVGSGLSDSQAADIVTRDRQVVVEALRLLLAEVTDA